MNSARFDTFACTLSSRRATLGGLLGGSLTVLLRVAEPEGAEAHSYLTRCRRIKNIPRRRTCLKKARAHNAAHRRRPRQPNAACPVSPTTFSSFPRSGWNRIAQTFTEPNGGHLAAVQLVLRNQMGVTGDYELEVNTVDPSTGMPTNSTIASTQVPASQVSTSDTVVTFFFAAPATLVAGRQYALVLARPNGTGDHHVPFQNPGPCPGGGAFFSESLTGSFHALTLANSETDLDYVTFVGS